MNKEIVLERRTASVLSIGDELLKGSTLNTNAQFLGKKLLADGFQVRRQVSCSDTLGEIKKSLHEELKSSDLVILSGGLGPTPDDLTRDAVADYFSAPLKFSSSQFQLIKKVYRRHGKAIPAIVRKEAMFPSTSIPLLNRYGIALGFYILNDKKMIVALPGVPQELENMYVECVRPLFKKTYKGLNPPLALIVRMTGISEPEVMKKLGKDFFDDPMEFGIYPAPGDVTLRIYSPHKKMIERLRNKIKTRLAPNIYAWEESSLAQAVGDILSRKKKTVAVAESCSSGLLAAEIASVSGASRYFLGGVIAYDNEVKEHVLKVAGRTLKKQGAVSRQTAVAMADGVKRLTGADYALSITGVAGPTRGTEKKPVGCVFIGLSTPRKNKVLEKQFWGTRKQVQSKSVSKALELLWREIR